MVEQGAQPVAFSTPTDPGLRVETSVECTPVLNSISLVSLPNRGQSRGKYLARGGHRRLYF